MELVKTYTVKKSSRNKLTKKQLKELRSHKYVFFERSWESLIFRLNYIRAVCKTNMEIHKHSLERAERLMDAADKIFPKELYEVGIVDKLCPTMLQFALNQKVRRTKISVTE